MSRMLKRVPLDFDYPLHKRWYGYLIQPEFCKSTPQINLCEECKNFARLKKIPLSESGCPVYDHWAQEQKIYFEPPEGPGFQLWEDVTEGSPRSPVFESMDDLVKWCEEHDTLFASRKATAEEWRRYLEEGKTGIVLSKFSVEF